MTTTAEKRKRVIAQPTPRQRRTARIIAEMAQGKHKDIEHHSQLMKKAGYGKGLQNVPHRVLKSDGVKMALADEGFSSETAKKVVAKILESDESKDENKLRAADLVFKVQGDYASDKIAKENNANPVIIAKIEQHIYNFESELKKALGYENTRIIEAKDENGGE